MKSLLISIGLLLTCSASLYAQDQVSGIIFIDQNSNGKLDRNEKGLENVSVSNGREVVATDNKGKYTLPISNDNIIFVIKPSGYTFPLDQHNLPQYYYIHKPQGSPELKYAGTAPTGKIPKQLNFPLLKSDEENEFSAFVFGDPQAYTLEELDFFKKGIIDDIQDKNQALFGISLGDLVGDDLTLHQPYKEAISTMGLPWWNVMGNHDMNYDVTSDSLSDEGFERAFGPNNYAFNYGNAHFIVLDNIIYPNPATAKGYTGGFREDQFQFIKNDLAQVPKDKLIILAYHIPVVGLGFDEGQAKRLFDLLAEYPNTFSMSAHTHFQTQLFAGNQSGRSPENPHHEYNVGTTSGDWYSGSLNAQGVPASTMRDGTPKGYALLHVKGNQYTFDYQVAGKEKSYQISLISPDVVSEKHSRRFTVYANFFIGRSTDVVEYRIDSEKWKKAIYAEEIDPDFLNKVYTYDFAKEFVDGRRPSNPVLSTHLWKFPLSKLSAGKHTIEVKAVDMFGREHFAKKEIEVVNK